MRLHELVTRADTIEHLKVRAEKAAALCDPIANHPLLFREFKTGINYETLIAKVVNQTAEGPRSPKFTKKGSAGNAQTAVLDKVGIQNPVFVVMSPPVSTWGFHGDPHIFIPPAGAQAYWSPEIQDLGGQRLKGGAALGHTDLGGGRSQTSIGVMEPEAEKWASSYVKGWPTQFTDHELIFDCDFYYLLNLKSFISKFVGVKNRDIIQTVKGQSLFTKIDQDLFNAKFKNYGSIAWYLRNTVPSYLDWYQQKYPHAK